MSACSTSHLHRPFLQGLASISSADLSLKCPQGHTTYGASTPQSGVVCNICGETVPVATSMLSCRQCDYDACLACGEAMLRSDEYGQALHLVQLLVVKKDSKEHWDREDSLDAISTMAIKGDKERDALIQAGAYSKVLQLLEDRDMERNRAIAQERQSRSGARCGILGDIFSIEMLTMVATREQVLAFNVLKLLANGGGHRLLSFLSAAEAVNVERGKALGWLGGTKLKDQITDNLRKSGFSSEGVQAWMATAKYLNQAKASTLGPRAKATAHTEKGGSASAFVGGAPQHWSTYAEWEQARAGIDVAIREVPVCPRSYEQHDAGSDPHLASTLSSSSRRTDNLQYLKEAYGATDQVARLFLRAERLQEKSQLDQAKLYFEEVLRLQPGLEEAQMNLDMIAQAQAMKK